jgi:hypothetical protein
MSVGSSYQPKELIRISVIYVEWRFSRHAATCVVFSKAFPLKSILRRCSNELRALDDMLKMLLCLKQRGSYYNGKATEHDRIGTTP